MSIPPKGGSRVGARAGTAAVEALQARIDTLEAEMQRHRVFVQLVERELGLQRATELVQEAGTEGATPPPQAPPRTPRKKASRSRKR